MEKIVADEIQQGNTIIIYTICTQRNAKMIQRDPWWCKVWHNAEYIFFSVMRCRNLSFHGTSRSLDEKTSFLRAYPLFRQQSSVILKQKIQSQIETAKM